MEADVCQVRVPAQRDLVGCACIASVPHMSVVLRASRRVGSNFSRGIHTSLVATHWNALWRVHSCLRITIIRLSTSFPNTPILSVGSRKIALSFEMTSNESEFKGRCCPDNGFILIQLARHTIVPGDWGKKWTQKTVDL